MTKQALAEMSGVSISFLSDLTTGKANPSLKVMEAIAKALNTPLPLMLEMTDLDPESLKHLSENMADECLPKGYEWVTTLLPSHKAFMVRRWGEEAKQQLARKKSKTV